MSEEQPSGSQNNASLTGFRQEIDATDREIVRLILRRAELAKQVGEAKRKEGGTVYRPDREKQVYKNIAAIAHELYGAESPFPVRILEHVYREIMSGSIAIEERHRRLTREEKSRIISLQVTPTRDCLITCIQDTPRRISGGAKKSATHQASGFSLELIEVVGKT